MRARVRHGVAAILASMVVASVAGPAGAESNGDPIDDSYQVLVHDGRTEVDPFQFYVFVKAVNQDGKLRVCGSYVAEMSDERFQQVVRMLHHAGSYLRIGGDGQTPTHVATGFLVGTRSLPVEQTPLGERLPRNRMHASCLDTATAWRDDFATAKPDFRFSELRYRPQIFGFGHR
jgi:hypothetical protein